MTSVSITPETRVRILEGSNLDFSDFDSFEVLGRSGVYKHTFRLKFCHPHGLVGGRWAIKREISGSIGVRSQQCRGGRPRHRWRLDDGAHEESGTPDSN